MGDVDYTNRTSRDTYEQIWNIAVDTYVQCCIEWNSIQRKTCMSLVELLCVWIVPRLNSTNRWCRTVPYRTVLYGTCSITLELSLVNTWFESTYLPDNRLRTLKHTKNRKSYGTYSDVHHCVFRYTFLTRAYNKHLLQRHEANTISHDTYSSNLYLCDRTRNSTLFRNLGQIPILGPLDDSFPDRLGLILK